MNNKTSNPAPSTEELERRIEYLHQCIRDMVSAAYRCMPKSVADHTFAPGGDEWNEALRTLKAALPS
jgi:hypothetical protein